MSDVLAGKTIAFAAAPEGVEQVELTDPWNAVQNAGGTSRLVSTEQGKVQGFHHLDRGDTFAVDVTFDEAAVAAFDALVLPGGVANPDTLRMNEAAVTFVRGFFDAEKPVAAICHAPWLLVEAGVVRGRTLTSWPSLRTDLTNAGAVWVDEELVHDQGLITSRRPDDLPVFCATLVKLFGGSPS